MKEPIFENIGFNLLGGSFNDKIKVDSKTDVPSDAISRILDVSAIAMLTEKEAQTGKIKYGGNVVFQVCYVDAEGAVKRLECGSEFLGVINDDKIKDACTVLASVKVDKADADLSGLKMSLSANVAVTAVAYDCAEVKAVSGGEGLILNKEEVSIVKSYGVKSGAYPIEEEFILDFPVKEVLTHTVKSVITNVQCGVGCIICDGEVVVSALIIGQENENQIIKEIRAIPFRMEIEYDEAMPAMRANARVREKSFKSDISVDGDTGKSQVNLTVTLLFDGEAFSDQTVTLATDAFDLKEDIELVSQSFTGIKPCELRSFTREVSGRSAVNELPTDASLMAICGEKAEIISVESKGEAVAVTGALSAVGFFKDGDGKSFSVRMETPFTVELDYSACEGAEIEILATVRNSGCKQISLTETELKAEIYFTVYPTEKQVINYVKEIKPLGEKSVENSAISVYIPFEGEELWSLAKRLNVCPEELAQTNKDLQFPLTGKERIVIYRQIC